MKKNHNIIGGAILNDFTLQKETSADVLDKFEKIGWLNSVFLIPSPEKGKSSFIALFNHLLAN